MKDDDQNNAPHTHTHSHIGHFTCPFLGSSLGIR